LSKFTKIFKIDTGWCFLILISVFNIVLVLLPLTNSLGYEFSAVNSILLFLIGGFYFIQLLKKNDFNLFNFWELLSQKKLFLIGFTFLPFLIGIVSTIILVKCPFVNGTLFYFLVTLPGYFAGIVFGVLSVFFSRKFSYVIFPFIFLTIAFASLVEIFFYPEISFFNLIIGYFPGTIYDEDLKVDNLLLAYRLLNVSFLIIVLYLIEKFNTGNLFKRFGVCLFILLLSFSFYLVAPNLKIATNKSRLEKTLHNSVTTRNFTIHFPDSTKYEEEIYAGLLHEYYFEQNNILLGASYNSKINSYIFYNKAQKRELIGAGNANLAKPWLNQIYLNKSSYEETLKHELVHVLASQYGVTPFKIASGFNSAMLEGFAMAIENNFDNYPAHYVAKLANQAGYNVNITSLFQGMNFFLQPSTISYVYAGSFIKYLIDHYGIEKIKLLYGDINFKKHFGKSLPSLSDEYNHFLEKYLINFNRNQAQFYFGGQTIFKKFCPRIAASDNKKAVELYRQGNIDEALKLYRKIYSYSNMVNALIGIEQCLAKQKKYNDATEYLKTEITRFKKSQYYYYLELLSGDILAESGKVKEALTYYDSLFAQNPHVDYLNSVMVRKTFLNEGIDSLKKFLDGSDKTKYDMLMTLNTNEIKYFSIPFIINIAEEERFDLSKFFQKIDEKIIPDDYLTSTSLMEISKYFLRKLDYGNAKFFAMKTINKSYTIDESHSFAENLKKVNWFKNYGNDNKRNFKFANGL
jgi:hypothetical protein